MVVAYGREMNYKKIMNYLVIIIMVIMVSFLVYAFTNGIFTTDVHLRNFLQKFGIFSALMFILIQITSVIFPVIPTSIGCVAGIIIFGPTRGFWYNYVAICIGSFVVYGLARYYGTDLVSSVIPPKIYEKYQGDTKHASRFEKVFLFAMVFPVSPDDVLCYMAGLSRMRIAFFSSAIFVGKAVSLLLYSYGITSIINYFK